MRMKLTAVLVLVCGCAVALGSSATARVGPPALQPGECGTPPCWTAFTVDGQPPTGITADFSSSGGNILMFIQNQGPPSSYELSPSLTSSSLIHLEVNVGTYYPAAFATTGNVQSYTTAYPSVYTATIDLKPTSSSWLSASCTTSSCGDPATAANVDYTTMAIGAISDLAGPSDFAYPTNAMYGATISTNAEAIGFPKFNPTTHAVSFQLAAPHLKADGTTPNTGFFKFFVPEAQVVKMGIADPTTVSQGSFTMTNSTGGTVNFSVTHVSSPAAGVEIDSTQNFTYSSPTFTLAPVVKSIAKAKCLVPKVVGKKLAAAKQAIAKAKCQTGSIKGAHSGSVKKGRVISQKPAAGTRLAKGGKVRLVVSKGKATKASRVTQIQVF